MLSEQISIGSARVSCFGLAAPSSSIWDSLTTDQQSWVASTLTAFNRLAYANGQDRDCPGGPEILNASRCFQRAFNAAIDDAFSKGLTPAYNGVALNKLNTFGVFDTDTLCALISSAKARSMAPPPDSLLPYCAGPIPANPMDRIAKQAASKAAMFGIAAGAATVIGGIVYLATRKPRRRRRR